MTALIFLGALIAPFLYAFTNHVDKFLLEKYFKEGGVGTLMLFSSLLSIIAIPVVLFVEPTVLDTNWTSTITLVFVGGLNLLLLWCYLQAMNEEEPTVVIIFYQLVPVLGLGLGYLVLGETISFFQGIAMALIIVGAIIMTLAIDEDGKFTFRLRSLGYMFVASLCWAGESTLFKKVALEENVWRSLFWENTSMAILGIVMFLLIPRYRKSFLKALRVNSKPILGLNVLNESVFIIGNMAASFMVVLIPVALNLLMNSFQPIFVFVMGVILSRVVPHHATEIISDRWKQKLIAIAFTGVGVYLIGDW
ncbi:MAG: EamA family transporter [Candidatus Pacebacteria bacterium]|nr:EamA family transporter [Candidatus Paceibacterota bacterium]